ncbi:MAG: PDZ domain-containing protein [Betaproteobacteria bacterium]|nr:PDZ domain-containing protein [Betaproteobacteria bacterium]
MNSIYNYRVFLFFFVGFTALFLQGCATPFSDHYRDLTQGRDIATSPRAVLGTGEPVVYRGGDKALDYIKMIEDGYGLLGYSSFNGPSVSLDGAIEQAKKAKATTLLWYSKYTNTVSGVVPLTLPSTQTTNASFSGTAGGAYFSGTASATAYGTTTSFIPYSINRSDYFVSYWIKLTPPAFGANVSNLPPEIRQRIGSNKGVLVHAIVNNSPAYKADIVTGDVLKRIGGDELTDENSYYDAIDKYRGKEVEVVLDRAGNTIQKAVRITSLKGSD